MRQKPREGASRGKNAFLSRPAISEKLLKSHRAIDHKDAENHEELESGLKNKKYRGRVCAKCEKPNIYIVSAHKNVNNSRTRRKLEILTSDSESGGRNTSTMHFSRKSETKNFRTLKRVRAGKGVEI